MKLLFLYGPPAVGKLTIAKILQKKTGYKLLHNHLLQNPITEVFRHENPENRLLVREFRLRILEEAAKSNSNLIATFGIAGHSPWDHIADVIRIVEMHNGNVCLVQLTAGKNTILDRVENSSRREYGKHLSKEKLRELLLDNPDMQDKYPKREHLIIDTERNSPEQSAETISKFYHVMV